MLQLPGKPALSCLLPLSSAVSNEQKDGSYAQLKDLQKISNVAKVNFVTAACYF